jgi:hypothetical protein
MIFFWFCMNGAHGLVMLHGVWDAFGSSMTDKFIIPSYTN